MSGRMLIGMLPGIRASVIRKLGIAGPKGKGEVWRGHCLKALFDLAATSSVQTTFMGPGEAAWISRLWLFTILLCFYNFLTTL